MQGPSPDVLESGLGHPGIAARLLAWRLPPIETYPALIALAQTFAGKLLLFGSFAALMKLHARGLWIEEGGVWLVLTIAAAAISLAGRHRHLALLVCGAALLAHHPAWFDFRAVHATIQREIVSGTVHVQYLRAATLIACVPLAVLAMYIARRYRDHPLARRPVLAQHVLCFCLLGLAASHLLRGLPQVVLWSATATFLAYFWFLAYALMDQRHRQPAPALFQLATFNPFTWPLSVPMGKGAANWRSVAAGTEQDLAMTQLKGLKLLAWALVLKGTLWVFRWVVYDKLGVPPLRLAFERFLLGGNPPGPLGLLSIIANFPEQLLMLALWGHLFVATARLAGFRLLRNTWRPLSSRSIAEFWNRYFYYFKEVLVDVYFYPTYVRWFKRHPRLRIAFATFMAAGVGNYFFHFILDNNAIASYGLLEALIRSQTYAFYCVLLVTGIVASQLRASRPGAGAGWLRARLRPSLGVAAFYCLLAFFDGPQRHVPLALHFEFLYQVSGIAQWIKAMG